IHINSYWLNRRSDTVRTTGRTKTPQGSPEWVYNDAVSSSSEEDRSLPNMSDPEQNQDPSFIHRTTALQPTRSISHYLIGRPLPTADAEHETVGKAVGLAIFASDALSSTAYATQEILVILAAAGTIAFGYVFPISIVIVGLLAIVVISYEQIVQTYPQGG